MSTTSDQFFNTAAQQTSDLDPATRRSLGQFRRRRSLLLVLRGIGVALLTFVLSALTVAMLDFLFFINDPLRWALAVGVYVATGAVVWFAAIRPLRQTDDLHLAKHLDSMSPTLREDLVSAVELSDPRHANGSPYFQRVLQSRVGKRIAAVQVAQLLPLKLVRRWLVSGFIVVGVCSLLMLVPSAQFGRRLARAALPGFSIERASRTKVTIVQPDPPTKYVAQGDAVAVVVSVLDYGDSEVLLQWQDLDGNEVESAMTPRLNPSDFRPSGGSETDEDSDAIPLDSADDSAVSAEQPTGDTFAANLSVGSTPLRYRILAGDAITSWHRLTPLPRPKVVLFEKLYRLPEYAQLNDRSAEEEHGDLKALQGTTAEVTVTFDQPVETAAIRYGVRGSQSLMEPVNEDGTKFKASVSIKTSGQYQVEATSAQSGLDNPFAPMNMIVPVLDLSPIVQWDKSIQMSQMVSSLDVLEMKAKVIDDLPISQIEQEITINGGVLKSYALPIDIPARQHDLQWSWDLLHRLGETSPNDQLKAGDLVRTRLVAVDRKGNRSTSPIIELLIAGDGFDADRHQFLEDLALQSESLLKWAEATQTLSDSVREFAKDDQLDAIAEERKKWSELQKDSVELVKQIRQTLAVTGNEGSAAITELSGRVVIDIETTLDQAFHELAFLDDHHEEAFTSNRKRSLSELASAAGSAKNQSQRLAEFTQQRFAAAFLSAMYADVNMLRQNVAKLSENLPSERLPRYLVLIAGQLKEIDRLLAKYETQLPTRTAQHLIGDRWSRWSERWVLQLETLVEERAERDQIEAVVESLLREVESRPQDVMDHGIHDHLVRLERDMLREVGFLTTETNSLRDRGRQWERSVKSEKEEKDANKAALAAIETRWHQLRFTTQLNRLLVRSAGWESLCRHKQRSDLDLASDLGLYSRAIKNVTESGFQPYKEESPEEVFNAIAKAIRILESTGELRNTAKAILAIRDGERQPDSSALRKIYHSIWMKYQNVRLELALIYLRDAGIDWEFLGDLDQIRHSDQWRSAQDKLDARIWRNDPFVSAALPLEGISRGIDVGETNLQQFQTEARQTLRKYVQTIAEQAREAAKQAREAAQKSDEAAKSTEQQDPSDAKATDQALESIDEAAEKATETVQSLIDEANTATITDEQQRQRARDADAAAEMIAEALRETKQTAKQAENASTDQQRQRAMEQAEQSLSKLEDRLQQTAEHFEKLDAGEDISESREQLRQTEQELQAAQQLQNRYEQAEQMARSASQDPRELLRQLEEELQRNEPMQESLSDISNSIVDDAVRSLRQSADQERQLQRSLEQDDDAFSEQKQQQRMLLEEFIQRAETLRDRTLPTAQSAAGWGNDADGRQLLEDARQQVDQAIKSTEQARRGDSTLSELQQAASQMQEQLREAHRTVDKASKQLGRSAERDLHQSDDARDRAAANMRQNENRLRNQELNALNQQRNRWNSNETQANQRINRAQQTIRESTESIKREQERLKNEPDNQWRKDEIAKQQDRLAEAERTEEQAKTTKQLARDRREDANRRANDINDTKANDLEKANPASELGQKLAENVGQRLENIARELDQMSQQSQFADDLRASRDHARHSGDRQDAVSRDVQQAADNLMRASRHEKRLEREAIASQLAEAAKRTEMQPAQSSKSAGDLLDKTQQDDSVSPQASEAISQASEQIDEQADRLTEQFQSASNQAPADSSSANSDSQASEQMNQQPLPSADATRQPNMSPSQNQNSPADGNSSDSQSRPTAFDQASPEQMAQTLDELDRSLSGSSENQSANQGQQDSQNGQAGNPSEGMQQSSGQPSGSSSQANGASQGDQAGQQSDASSAGNAAQASPTLAQMLDAQLQAAAKQRMQSLAQAQSGQQGDQSQGSKQSSNPVSEAGSGEPPNGSNQVGDVDIVDGDWGDLREQGVENANQGRKTRIPRGYAAEVKAYFKAISKRSAETKE
ncbi:hypothetical protein LOC67_22330 [Stieleria sp. JC731]|uniref:hypothetical protein n=1 Tax=Pirellulaceae TaxID=2691357 RepID=UPI001E325A16|nr:hypothetical protein [Stieleria sp. JC731]MCC9603296.1 hypothetical protein [Stieleria sp. JC731]